jgi:hypothetical protein
MDVNTIRASRKAALVWFLMMSVSVKLVKFSQKTRIFWLDSSITSALKCLPSLSGLVSVLNSSISKLRELTLEVIASVRAVIFSLTTFLSSSTSSRATHSS